MKILCRYVIKNFTKIFLFTTTAFVIVEILVGLLERMEFYIEHKASYYMVIIHILSNMPWWLMQALPVSTLLSLLFSLENLSKRNEITAMKAAGVNIWQIIVMFLMLGFMIGVGDFSVREFVVPKTSAYHEIVTKEKIAKKEMKINVEFLNLIVTTPNNERFTIGRLNTQDKTMKYVTIEKYNDEFTIESLILAEAGSFENNTWILNNGVKRDFNADVLNETYFEFYDTNLHIKPKDMIVQNVSYDTMSTKTFKKYINQLRTFGQVGLKERYALIALNIRYAAVFSHIVVMMIGIPFALGLGKKLNKILSFMLALFAAFIYWGTQVITRSLGDNFILSPFMAAWLPNFIFAAIGVYLLAKVKK